MKTALPVLLLCCASIQVLPAEIIAQWSFNSVPPDGSPSTGTTNIAAGSGWAALLNGTTATFSAGSTNDPATSFDDSGWNTSAYPADGSSNKTAGVQFAVNTLSYSDILVRWDLRVSSSASKYYRLQYSSDGTTFSDHASPAAAQAIVSTASYYEAQTNNLSAVTELNNNPNVVFRIVSEFQSTATGSGTNGYVTTFGTNNYSKAGTVRFDWVTISGTPIPGANTPPTISSVSNQVLRVNQTSAPLTFAVNDAQDPPGNLSLNKSSSDPAVLPEANLVFNGSGSSRTVTLTTTGQTGSSILTLYVIDSGGRSNSTSFTVTVLPANTSPFISPILPTNTLANSSTPSIAFSVGDAETEASALSVSANSLNPGLLPNGNVLFGGSGSNRTLILSPAAGHTGVAPLTITVSDGTNTANASFPLMVTPSASLLFYEPFAYPDGSVLTNSAFLWDNRSGTFGQMQVTNEQLLVTTSQTEDVVGALIGSPYNVSNSLVLYAAFKATFLSLPKTSPEYFAHFANGSTLRGRVYAGTTNAPPGSFRLQVANGSDTVSELPADLQTNTTYTVVTRYNIDHASTTLWLNPTAENDANVSASDTQNATRVGSYGIRQDSGLGASILIDDLKVGLSFAAVLSTNAVPTPILLKIRAAGNQSILSWPDAAFNLQSAPAVGGPYTNVPGAASPHTNPISGLPRFFRLKLN